MRIEASNNFTNPKKNIRFEFLSAKHVGWLRPRTLHKRTNCLTPTTPTSAVSQPRGWNMRSTMRMTCRCDSTWGHRVMWLKLRQMMGICFSISRRPTFHALASNPLPALRQQRAPKASILCKNSSAWLLPVCWSRKASKPISLPPTMCSRMCQISMTLSPASLCC